MLREYHLWVATDGEVRVSPEAPEPGRNRGRSDSGSKWLPSGLAFTQDEAVAAQVLYCNKSRDPMSDAYYLNGGEALGSGPWSEGRESALLDEFERVIGQLQRRREAIAGRSA